jgi:hypothetical protein
MWRKAQVLGHRPKEIAECVAFFGVKARGELNLVLACETTNLAHQLPSLCGQVEGISAAITAVAATLDIPTLLKVVQVADKAARHDAQVGAERLLAAAGICRDGAEDPRVFRAQVEGRELFGEQRGGVKAKLAQ